MNQEDNSTNLPLPNPSSPLMGPGEAWPVPEMALANELGLPRALLRQYRKGFERGVHWELVEGEVRLSESTAETIRQQASPGNAKPDIVNGAGVSEYRSIGETHADTPTRRHADTHSNGSYECLVVMRANLPNPSLILAASPELAENHRQWRKVKVQSSRLFKVGMQLAAKHLYGDLWKCVGNPALQTPERGPQSPRMPGRW